MSAKSIIVAQLAIPEWNEMAERVQNHTKRTASLVTQVKKLMEEGENLRTLAFAGGYNALYVELVTSKKDIKSATKGPELDTEIVSIVFPDTFEEEEEEVEA